MCRGDLAGMFDGPTSPTIDLTAPLLVFDLSEVDPESPALAVAMCVIGTWLSQVWARQDGVQRIFVLEEGWHVLSRASTARLLRRLWKFARGLGLSNVAVLHHLSDVPVAGTAGAEALAVVKEAGTKVVYRQDADDAAEIARLLGLPASVRDTIPLLPQGVAVWVVGKRVRIVQHLRSTWEETITDTDAALTLDGSR